MWSRPWLQASLWAALIFVSSSIPGDQIPSPWTWSPDKLIHVVIFGVLAVLVYRACIQTFSASRAITGTILVCTLYAVSDEVHQLFVRNRSCEFLDVVADVCGILIGVAGFTLWRRNRVPAG